MVNEGWICPRCGRVNAPWSPWCNCESVSNSNTNTTEYTPIRDFMVNPKVGEEMPITGDRKDMTMNYFCPNCGRKMEGAEMNIFDDEEIHTNCIVQIWKNKDTGRMSIGWKEEGD